VHFLIGQGICALKLVKNPVKVREVIETHRVADFGNGQFSPLEERSRLFDADFVKVSLEGLSSHDLEGPCEMVLAHAAFSRYVGKRQAFLEIVFYEQNRFSYCQNVKHAVASYKDYQGTVLLPLYCFPSTSPRGLPVVTPIRHSCFRVTLLIPSSRPA
jgi:hypothetical protein